MKKTLALILTALFLLSCSACGDNTPSTNTPNPSTGSSNESSPAMPSTDTESIIGQKLYATSVFSEGYCFVTVEDYDGPIHCIDKNGNIRFQVEKPYRVAHTFSNGLAVLYNTGDVVLCNTEGKITKPEDLGGTSFVIDCTLGREEIHHTVEMFKDNYIFVERITTDYTGSKYELAVIDNELNFILDYSEQLYQIYNAPYTYGGCKYYDGYLYVYGERYLNLRTGEEVTDNFDNFFSAITIEYDSDFWKYRQPTSSKKYIYDYKTDSIVLDLSQHETLSDVGSFCNGIAPLIFHTPSANGLSYYFTLIGEDGVFKFDPVQLKGDFCRIRESNGKYIITTAEPNGMYDFTCYHTVFDETGLLAEAPEALSTTNEITFSDNVIIAYTGNTYEFFNADFSPLF